MTPVPSVLILPPYPARRTPHPTSRTFEVRFGIDFAARRSWKGRSAYGGKYGCTHILGLRRGGRRALGTLPCASPRRRKRPRRDCAQARSEHHRRPRGRPRRLHRGHRDQRKDDDQRAHSRRARRRRLRRGVQSRRQQHADGHRSRHGGGAPRRHRQEGPLRRLRVRRALHRARPAAGKAPRARPS